MTPAALLEMAERVEALKLPDREFDDAISAVVASPHGNRIMLPYTSSLDAAMQLVPEGWTAWGVWTKRGKTQFYAVISRLRDDLDEDGFDDEMSVRSRRCVSPALALTAAALRARASAGER